MTDEGILKLEVNYSTEVGGCPYFICCLSSFLFIYSSQEQASGHCYYAGRRHCSEAQLEVGLASQVAAIEPLSALPIARICLRPPIAGMD